MAVRKFKLYNATIMLGGQMTHAIPKQRITAPELALLASLHGPDAIIPRSLTELEELREADEYELREELCAHYKTANVDGAAILAGLFGALGALPTDVKDAVPGLQQADIEQELSPEDSRSLAALMEQGRGGMGGKDISDFLGKDDE